MTNFRIGQKVRCIHTYKSENQPKEGRVYTVIGRNIHKGDTYVTLEGIKIWKVFLSSHFECAEVMEDVDKIVNDLISGKKPISTMHCSCVDMPPFKMDILRDCTMNPLTDRELVSKWKRSVKNEEYEDSQIYHDEIIKRGINQRSNVR